MNIWDSTKKRMLTTDAQTIEIIHSHCEELYTPLDPTADFKGRSLHCDDLEIFPRDGVVAALICNQTEYYSDDETEESDEENIGTQCTYVLYVVKVNQLSFTIAFDRACVFTWPRKDLSRY